MSVLAVGSVAYDSVVTPSGSRQNSLGGSATFFSVASSYFTDVSVLAIVGEDFRSEDIDFMKNHGVDINGLELRRGGKTFRWSGLYGENLNTRETLETQLNVFADFSPKIPCEQKKTPFLFLANADPDLQLSVLAQMDKRPQLVALDTMNYWIEGKNRSLNKVIENVDLLFVDEGEARAIAGQFNLIRCAEHIIGLGPKTIVIKRGEHGVLVFQGSVTFSVPGFPLVNPVDPTGAGDSFAGGFMGHLSSSGDLSLNGFRRATVIGSVMGSFAVESFGIDRIGSLGMADIDARFRAFTKLSQFVPLCEGESLSN